MKRLLTALLSTSMLCIPGLSRAQQYEIIPQFADRYIVAASQDGNRLILGQQQAIADGWYSDKMSLYDGKQEIALTLSGSGTTKGWAQKVLAINNKGQFLSEMTNWDAKDVHFRLGDATGASTTILDHEFRSLWSTQGMSFDLNDAGQALIELSEESNTLKDDSITRVLYFYNGVGVEKIVQEGPSPLMSTEGLQSFALSEDGRIAYTSQAKGKKTFQHYIREIDGSVRLLNLPSLAEFGFVHSFTKNRLLFGGKSAEIVYDLVTGEITPLYPNSDSLMSWALTSEPFNGEQVTFNALRKSGDTFRVYIGTASLSQGISYMDCPLPFDKSYPLYIAALADGKSFLVSLYGTNNPKGVAAPGTYLLRPSTGAAGAQSCTVYTSPDQLTSGKAGATQVANVSNGKAKAKAAKHKSKKARAKARKDKKAGRKALKA